MPAAPSTVQTIRMSEWWEYKLSPILATAYATALMRGLPLATAWPALLLALGSLIPGAAYVSILNDLTDRADDAASGKANRMAGRSTLFVVLALGACLLPGAAVAAYWRDDLLLLGLYLAAWLAFSFYSLRPVRLKGRGIFGALADAAGSNLFPMLLVVTIVSRRTSAPLNLFWLGLVGVWALNYGLRGILWHQLCDLENDRRAGVRTFAVRRGALRVQWLCTFVVFPLEVLALSGLLWRLNSLPALCFLFAYMVLEWSRAQFWGVQIIVVVPQPRYHIALHEYYEALFPLALLLTSAIDHPTDALVLAVHLVLFPRRGLQLWKDAGLLIKVARERVPS